MFTIGHGRPVSLAFVVESLSRVIPPERIKEALAKVDSGQRRRIRRVSPTGTVWLVACIGLFGDLDVPSIWRQVVGTYNTLIGVLHGVKPVTKSALSQARQRLGARVMRVLFRMRAKPIAVQRKPAQTAEPPSGDRELGSAYYRGMRVVAIDTQKMLMPDTPENGKAFGRHSTTRNGQTEEGAYPQLSLTQLVEVGTHISLEALIKPACHSERAVAGALLKKSRPAPF